MQSLIPQNILKPAPNAQIPYAEPSQPFCGLVLVGEAPGAEENRLKQPFVGRSGQLLNTALKAAGIERSACWVMNVFRTQPPGNKLSHFFASKRMAERENIELAEKWGKFSSAFCRKDAGADIEFLEEKLTFVRPKIIVALGRTAFWALTGKDTGLLAQRGITMPSRLGKNLEIIATYHPSFILRGNFALQPQWVADLEFARQKAL